jgi:hypothetical protein
MPRNNEDVGREVIGSFVGRDVGGSAASWPRV